MSGENSSVTGDGGSLAPEVGWRHNYPLIRRIDAVWYAVERLACGVMFLAMALLVFAAVVSDIRSKYVGLRAQLALYDFTVFYGLPAPLLISEAPFIDWRVQAKPVQPFVSLPLGPYCILVGTPSGKKSRAGPVLWKTVGAMGPFKDHNRYIVDYAHRWIVATSEDQLVALQDRFAPDTDGNPAAVQP